MEFHLEHALPCPLAAVEHVLLSPGFVTELAARARALSEARLVHYADAGATLSRETWYRADAARLIGPFARLGVLAWTERVEYVRAEHAGSFTVVPDVGRALRRRVRCEGRYELAVADGPAGAATRRVVRGVIDVRAPLVGRAAEERVVAMLRELFDDEAALLAERAR